MSQTGHEQKFWEVSDFMGQYLKLRVRFIALGAAGVAMLWAYLFFMGVSYTTEITGPYMMVLFPFVIFLFIPCLWALFHAWHRMRTTAEEIFPSYAEGVIAAFIFLALFSAAPMVYEHAVSGSEAAAKEAALSPEERGQKRLEDCRAEARALSMGVHCP